MEINLENLEIIPNYSIEWVSDERGKYPMFHWKSIMALSQSSDAKVTDTVDILPLLCHDQLVALEEKILSHE